jgi:hypothetical protein
MLNVNAWGANVDWPEPDKLNERGERDRRFVSLTEKWEIDNFINSYLNTRGCARTDLMVRTVEAAIAGFAGSSPVPRDDLTAYLDDAFR